MGENTGQFGFTSDAIRAHHVKPDRGRVWLTERSKFHRLSRSFARTKDIEQVLDVLSSLHLGFGGSGQNECLLGDVLSCPNNPCGYILALHSNDANSWTCFQRPFARLFAGLVI